MSASRREPVHRPARRSLSAAVTGLVVAGVALVAGCGHAGESKPLVAPRAGAEAIIVSTPAALEDVPGAMLALFDAVGEANAAAAALSGWDAHVGSAVLSGADGRRALVGLVVDPTQTDLASAPAHVLVVEPGDEGARVALRLDAWRPSLLAIADVTGDGADEATIVSKLCGAHTCDHLVHVIGRDGGEWRDLTGGAVSMASAEISLVQRDTDSALELMLRGGQIGSVGAGPQRDRTEVYDWTGADFSLAETIWSEPTHPLHMVLDANEAMANGRVDEAIALYERATGIKGPAAAMAEPDTDLRAYGLFRLMLAHVLTGDMAAAEDRARQIGSGPYASAADVFWDVVARGGDAAEACRAVATHVGSHPESFGTIAWGYGNPEIDPASMCPLAEQ